jgi:hydrogenase maturation protein HypF
MIGGEQAIYQPWRNTYAHLLSADLWETCQQEYSELEIIKFLQQKPLKLINQALAQGINSPLASSVGRLFDGVAAAMGIFPEECSYEGQAAIAMEALVNPLSLNNYEETLIYPFEVNFSDSIYYIDSKPMWPDLLQDLQKQVKPSDIARKFHQSLSQTIVNLVKHLCHENVINQVALTGGVFQNCILLAQVKAGLENLGIHVLTHNLFPANDGNISLGQAVITAAQLMRVS